MAGQSPFVFRALCALLRLAVLAAGLWALPAAAANCNLATSQGSTGPSDWQTYCWLDLASYNEATARTAGGQNFSYTLPDGTVMTFRLRVTGTPTLVASTSPSWTGAAVGNTAFLGISGRPILYQSGAGGTSTVTISNIALTPPAGGTVTSYMFVAADAESTNGGETLQFQTNGGNWSILGQIGPISGNTYPNISGAGTQTFTETGVDGTVGAYIVGSTSPTTITTTLVGSGLQGAMFAVRFASITLNTVISGARIAAADQFTFTIAPTGGGAAYASGTSTGTGLGPFTAAALPTSAALPLTLTQAMATGSSSTVAQYRSSLTCINATTGSSTVMPTNVITTSHNFGTLQFGDRVTCTYTETPFPHLRLTKALGAGGRQFDTDQFKMDIQQGATVVATTTTTGTGTTVTNPSTPLYQATAGTAYTVEEEAAGTTVLAQYIVAMACTNANGSSSTTLPTTSGGSVTPQMGDVIACTITNTKRTANATLAITKTSSMVSDPYRGTTNPLSIPGAVVRYTIQISNSGASMVTNNSVFIFDALPPEISVGTAASPSFTQGTPSSGLTFNAANDIRYSNAGTAPANFAACTYTPTSAYDAAVRYVCLNPKGTMAGSTGTPPSFSLTFNAQIK